MQKLRNLALSLLPLLPQDAPPPCPPVLDAAQRAQRIAWLAEVSVPLASLEFDAADDAGLEAIARAVGDRRVLCLGEAGHGDGSAFAAKARIARYMHAEAGFDWIVFESGFYECDRAWRLAGEGVPLGEALQGAVHEIWSCSAEVRPLIDYMQAELAGERPLRLAGMDLMPTGRLFGEAGAEIRAAALEAEIDADVVSEGTAVLGELRESYRRLMEADETGREAIFSGIGELKESLRESHTARLDFHAQVLDGFEACLRMVLSGDLAKPEGGPGLNARDLQMARNIAWLLHAHPGDKFMVWGASSHLSRRRDLLEVRTAPKMVPCGEHLRRMGESVYLLGVTSAGGSHGSAREGATRQTLEPASVGALEDLWREVEGEGSFLDWSALETPPTWLAGRFSSRAMGHADICGHWMEVMDGLVFVEEMEPAARLPWPR